jgi:hypothetical protein
MFVRGYTIRLLFPATASRLALGRPWCEADHSAASSAEVKNAWSDTSVTFCLFMAWFLIKNGDTFTVCCYTVTVGESQEMGRKWPWPMAHARDFHGGTEENHKVRLICARPGFVPGIYVMQEP